MKWTTNQTLLSRCSIWKKFCWSLIEIRGEQICERKFGPQMGISGVTTRVLLTSYHTGTSPCFIGFLVLWVTLYTTLKLLKWNVIGPQYLTHHTDNLIGLKIAVHLAEVYKTQSWPPSSFLVYIWKVWGKIKAAHWLKCTWPVTSLGNEQIRGLHLVTWPSQK